MLIGAAVLAAVAVVPEFRHRGLGSRISRFLVKRILENGIPVNDNTMVEVLDLCDYLGLDFGSYFGDYRPPVKKDVFKGNY